MSKPIRPLHFGPLAVMACWSAQASADEKLAVHTPASEIQTSIAKTTDGSVAQQLKTDASTPVWVIRRDGQGKVEVHVKLNDVIIAREGTATVVIGETVEGNQEIKPNEWLGGRIIGGRTYTLAPGDMIFIPAGLGHAITPAGGGSFSYFVVKTEAKH